jgi:hypothetical protein
MINWCFGDIPLLTEHGNLCSRICVVDEDDVADLKVIEELGATTPVPQVAAPPRTRTRMVIKTNLGIPNSSKISEIDGFRPDPKTPQLDGVQRRVVLLLCIPSGGT